MVDDEAVSAPSGRAVRCANCGHSWQYMTPPPASPPAPPRVRLRERAEALKPPDPVAAAPRAAITAPPPPRQRRSSGLGWIVVILLLGGAAVGAILGRERIVALWPQAARVYEQATRLYEMTGLKAEPLGAGLDIANVTSTRNSDGLVVEGDITNKVGEPRGVPHLRVALRDGNQHELVFKIVDPPRERLLPGETSHFVVGFLPAPDAATGVVVTFAPS